jgi:hypothetical protein
MHHFATQLTWLEPALGEVFIFALIVFVAAKEENVRESTEKKHLNFLFGYQFFISPFHEKLEASP